MNSRALVHMAGSKVTLAVSNRHGIHISLAMDVRLEDIRRDTMHGGTIYTGLQDLHPLTENYASA